MTITEVERATLRLALSALEVDPDTALPMRELTAILGREWTERIAERRAEFVDANHAASGVSLLSSSAQDYWIEARGVLAYGRLVHSMGSRKAEKALSLKCEALDESFPARVSAAERGRFLVYEVGGAAWDDRWHACFDHYFPLLRAGGGGGAYVENTLREAQMEILAEFLMPSDPVLTSQPSTMSQRLLKIIGRWR